MRKLLAIAAAACIGGCAQTHFPCDLAIDSSFTETDRCLINEAAARWYEATDGEVDIRAEVGALVGHRIVQVTSAEATARAHPGARGYANYDGPLVWIVTEQINAERPAARDRVFLTVVMHEFGHHAGLQHTPIAGSLMYWNGLPPQPCIYAADVDEFCSMYDCSLGAPACAPVPECGG